MLTHVAQVAISINRPSKGATDVEQSSSTEHAPGSYHLSLSSNSSQVAHRHGPASQLNPDSNAMRPA